MHCDIYMHYVLIIAFENFLEIQRTAYVIICRRAWNFVRFHGEIGEIRAGVVSLTLLTAI